MANWPPLPADRQACLPQAGTNHEKRLIPLLPPLEKGGWGDLMVIFTLYSPHPNSDLENELPFPFCHCEHLKGAWQSHWERLHFTRNDNFLNRDLGHN